MKNTAITIRSLKDKILSILKLDEAGKIESFLEKQVKMLQKSIITNTKNLEKFVAEIRDNIETLDEQIEDAEQALEDAYAKVTLKDVETNDAMNNFSDIYWDNIDNCQQTIKKLEENKKLYLTTIDSETRNVEEIISNLKQKIEAIS
jgi:hypothetical protein